MNPSADYTERLTNVEKIVETLVQQKAELYRLAELQLVVTPEKMPRKTPRGTASRQETLRLLSSSSSAI